MPVVLLSQLVSHWLVTGQLYSIQLTSDQPVTDQLTKQNHWHACYLKLFMIFTSYIQLDTAVTK